MGWKIQPVPLMVMGVIVVMMLYGIFMPLSDKCLLIPDLEDCGGNSEITILSESTGLLKPTENAVRYTFENVQLFRRDSLEIDTIFDEVSAQKSWFTKATAKTEFDVQEGGTDVKLFIVVNSAIGKLKVKVNGKTVDKLKGEGVHEVSLPLGLLENENTLELKSTTPIIPFIRHKHVIGKVSMREEYTITKNRVSREFNLNQDLEGIDRAILRFDTDCFYEDNLSVMINGEKIFTGVLCEGFEKDVVEYLKDENEITFASEGNYFVNKIRVDVGMKQQSWPKYYFDVSEKKIEEGSVKLKLLFRELGEKKLSVYLNGEPLSIDTRKIEFETTVTKYLNKGQNEIILIAETELALEKIELI